MRLHSQMYVGERRHLTRHLPTRRGTLPSGPVEVLGFVQAARSPVILANVRREATGEVYAVPALRLREASYRMGVGETA